MKGQLSEGRSILPHRGIYIGDFNLGLPVSLGCEYVDFETNSSYTGEFKQWKRHGNGTITMKNGESATGTWEDDEKHGEFILSKPNDVNYIEKWDKGCLIDSRR